MKSGTVQQGSAFVAGSVVLDLVAPIKTFPKSGEQQLLSAPPTMRLGGPGLAGAVAVGRHYEDSHLIACMGADSYGAAIKALVQEQAPSLSLPLGLDGLNTSYTWIVCDGTGERTFMHYPGANGQLDADHIIRSIDNAPNNSLLFIAGVGILKALEGMNLHRALAAAKDRGCIVGFSTQNPGGIDFGAGLERIKPALEISDVVVLSNKDIETFLGIREAKAAEAAENVIKAGANRVMVTMGQEGAIVGFRGKAGVPNNWMKISGFPVEAKDTTGCGDCAGAIFALKIWQGFDPLAAATRACAEGAIVAERGEGAHGAPTSAEVEQLISKK